MADSLFDTLQQEVRSANIQLRSRSARNWFRGRLSKLGSIDPSDVLKDPGVQRVGTVGPGHMHMFVYDPKTKDNLPFYDKFPLTIVVEPAPGGFYGLNLHYLAPGVRAAFLDKLMLSASDDRMDEKTKFRITYDYLKSVSRLKEFKPCFKRYLTTHIQSRIVKIEAKDWPIAIFLPTENFEKASKRKVWSDSRGRY